MLARRKGETKKNELDLFYSEKERVVNMVLRQGAFLTKIRRSRFL
jgi:hypothetical protein